MSDSPILWLAVYTDAPNNNATVPVESYGAWLPLTAVPAVPSACRSAGLLRAARDCLERLDPGREPPEVVHNMTLRGSPQWTLWHVVLAPAPTSTSTSRHAVLALTPSSCQDTSVLLERMRRAARLQEVRSGGGRGGGGGKGGGGGGTGDELLARVQSKAEGVKVEMQQAVHKALDNVTKVQKLEEDSQDLLDGARDFERGATRVRRKMCARHYKTLCVAGVVAALVVALIVLAALRNT